MRRTSLSGRRMVWLVAVVGAACAGALACGARSGHAAVYTWTQYGTGTFNWSSAGNWASGTAVSGAGNTVALFGPSGTYAAGFTTTSNLDYGGGNLVLNQLQLTGSSNALSGT
ncbi:MAG: hypothetical protein ACR2IT_08530, partial [Pirellulales bacterium]